MFGSSGLLERKETILDNYKFIKDDIATYTKFIEQEKVVAIVMLLLSHDLQMRHVAFLVQVAQILPPFLLSQKHQDVLYVLDI